MELNLEIAVFLGGFEFAECPFYDDNETLVPLKLTVLPKCAIIIFTLGINFRSLIDVFISADLLYLCLVQ